MNFTVAVTLSPGSPFCSSPVRAKSAVFAAVTSASATGSGWFVRSASVAGPFSTRVSGSPVPGTGSVEPASPGLGSSTPTVTRRSSRNAESSALSDTGFAVP
ncbi:hypothetical protein GA0115255_112842 [Streptomyces sp. Ncost-T6T-2b]|nr:hypothetical protein GA0115255_112842 [Streptomyces sp. Ncost-T6T-2b]